MLCACTPFSPIHNGSPAATKLPRADEEAVPPCSFRVLAAASVGLLATANFRECPKGELRRIPIPRTPVNKGKKKRRAGAITPRPSYKGQFAAGASLPHDGYLGAVLKRQVVSSGCKWLPTSSVAAVV